MTLGLRMIRLMQPRVRAKFRLRVSIHYMNIVPHTGSTSETYTGGWGGGGSDLTTDHTLTAVTVVTTG